MGYGKKVQANFEGKLVDAIELDFQTKKEEWNEYEVADGTTIRVKLVTSNIVRVQNRYDNEGNPIYLVKSSNVVGVSVPERLKKEGLKLH